MSPVPMQLPPSVRSLALDGRAIRTGAALLFSALLPVHGSGSEMFIWELSDPTPLELLLAFAPALAGATLLIAHLLARGDRSWPVLTMGSSCLMSPVLKSLGRLVKQLPMNQ